MIRSALALVLLLLLLPLLPAQDFSEIRFDQLVKNVGFAEGPAWSKDGFLIFSDT